MRYISTRCATGLGGALNLKESKQDRNQTESRRFCEILLEGLAPDGGLYLPESYPVLTLKDLSRLQDTYDSKGYAYLAFEILSLFIDDIPQDDLKRLCLKTYTTEVFGDPLITPIRLLEPGLYIQALSNGPTLAFKDMAMQLLGNLFEYQLSRTGQSLNILGATSGDTGSAAEYAMRGKRGVKVFMTSPKDRMSAFQQAQMFSLQDENIFNIAVEGVFDDCQDIVKSVSADLAFKSKYSIGTVNSINWARLLAQVVYYFAGYFQVISKKHSNLELGKLVSFTVPSGNFGNVCAGHVARMMGLPIDRLVVATNENDVLDEFFKTGVYKVRNAQNTHETSSPSMDISKASNFERFVFDLLDRDSSLTNKLFALDIASQGRFDLSENARFKHVLSRFGFVSGRSTHSDRLKTIQSVYKEFNQMIDPHTADGVKVAREQRLNLQSSRTDQPPMVVLETALPIKFASTIVEALGVEPLRPSQFNGIELLPRRVHNLPADVSKIKAYIEQHCAL